MAEESELAVTTAHAPALIGVVVVTHGQLATELVNAAEMIVGDLPRFAAVSIGWHDDVETAREAIAAAIARVQGEAGVLVLTDMFGGTPSNLGITFLEQGRVEVITGVNLPMLIKLADLRSSSGLVDVARAIRESGRNAIWVASDPDARRDPGGRVTTRVARVTNALGLHARAAARFVHLAASFASQMKVGHQGRIIDGKSIMGLLLLAAAKGTDVTITADGVDEQAALEALCGLIARGFDGARMPILNGLGVSAGVASGRALVVRPRQQQVFYLVPDDATGEEVARLAEAQARSRSQIEEIGARLARLTGPGPASLFEAQLLMLEDPMLIGRAEQLIRDERRNAEWALQHAASELAAMMDEAHDTYLRERHGDVRDVVGRVVMNLRGEARGIVLPESSDPWVLVADELPPSVAAQVNWERARGFVTEAGSWTYHTAILARSLGVPAVVGVTGATSRIEPGSDVVLDGTTGEVVVNGQAADRVRLLDRTTATNVVAAAPARPGRLTTADGVAVRLDANLELPTDLADVLDCGADGIGLFRSEFLLGEDGRAPDEDRQVAIYRDLLARTPGGGQFRTFDPKPVRAGGLRDVPDAQTGHHLGLRALQFDATFRELFAQVRALLRAASAGRLRILLPFVTSAHDVHLGRALILGTADALRAEGIDVPVTPVGAMVEVPSAALTADHLAEEADFLSVGTNDLIALTLAVDRDDERASRFYAPLHPSMLRLLRFVSRAGVRAHRRVAVCGEMAADPRTLTVLLGLGFREFSMAPAAIARAGQVIAHVGLTDARRIVRQALHRSDTFDADLDALVRVALDARVGSL